ncbi:MAG: hypothetical protein AB7I30_23795 [Isosphaeraceae bacterium]
MRRSWEAVLHWTPRLLCALFAGFLSLFALDVFSEGHGFWRTLLALAIHLIPGGIVLGLLAISWRWERFGGLLLVALGLAYVVMAWGRFPVSTYFVVAGPAILTGILFMIGGLYRRRARIG